MKFDVCTEKQKSNFIYWSSLEMSLCYFSSLRAAVVVVFMIYSTLVQRCLNKKQRRRHGFVVLLSALE